jgi:hypothetical protein
MFVPDERAGFIADTTRERQGGFHITQTSPKRSYWNLDVMAAFSFYARMLMGTDADGIRAG